jgi:hypothetical protein
MMTPAEIKALVGKKVTAKHTPDFKGTIVSMSEDGQLAYVKWNKHTRDMKHNKLAPMYMRHIIIDEDQGEKK